MQGSLRKEMWLPVLNDGGKVIGCIARSVSRSLPKSIIILSYVWLLFIRECFIW